MGSVTRRKATAAPTCQRRVRPSGPGRSAVARLERRVPIMGALDYIELFHNARRRHSALGMLSPTEYEERYFRNRDAA